MKLHSPLLTALAVSSALLAPAQDHQTLTQQGSDSPENSEVRDVAELGVSPLPTEDMNPYRSEEFIELLQVLAGESIWVQDGKMRRPEDHFKEINGRYVVLDVVDERERIVDLAEDLRAQLFPEVEETIESEDDPYRVEYYVPRHLDVEAVVGTVLALGTVDATPLDGVRGLLLQGDSSSVDVTLELLDTIDVPEPQVLLELLVLGSVEGSDEALERAPLPEELAQGLTAILPHQDFAVLTRAMLRSSASQRDLGLTTSIGDAALVYLAVERIGYDPVDAMATLSGCSLELNPTNPGYAPASAQTSISLAAGEYVVLSSAGANNLLFVLRVTEV
ncbi:MAG: hypothetical protein AAFZ65_02275 [Planctomycetota bacterium]